MELGIGMFGDSRIDPVTGQIQAAQDRMKEIIEEIKLMDQVGFCLLYTSPSTRD